VSIRLRKPSIELVVLGALLPFAVMAQDFKESSKGYIPPGRISDVKFAASSRASTGTSRVKCESGVTVVEVATSGWHIVRAEDGPSGSVSHCLLSSSKPMETGLLRHSETKGASQSAAPEPLPLKSWVGEVSVWTPETFEPGEIQVCFTSAVLEGFLLCGKRGFDQFFRLVNSCIINAATASAIANKGTKSDEQQANVRAKTMWNMCDAQSLTEMKNTHGKTFIVSFDRTPWPERKSELRAEPRPTWKCTKERSVNCASLSYPVSPAKQDSSSHP
jgi:hypothetical protein